MLTRRSLAAAFLGAALPLFPCFAQEPAPPTQLPASDWASIRAAYEGSRHEVRAVEGGHRARNPGQLWSTLWDGRGFTTTPDAGHWQWGLELASYGWGNDRNHVERPRSVAATGGRIAYQWDDLLTEWYANDRRGLEHGYTVAARGPAAGGQFCIELTVRGHLAVIVAADGRDVRFVDELGCEVVRYAGLAVFDAGGHALDASWQATDAGLRLSVDERTAAYPLTIDPIATQQAYLKASNTDTADEFGFSVAVAGDTIVVGAPNEDSSTIGNQADNSAADSGAAYVFVRTGSTWSQQAYLKAGFPGTSDLFGYTVAVSGDTIVVGAPLEDSNATGVNGNSLDNSALNSGAAFVFVRSGGFWTQQAYLKASNTDASDVFGSRVAIDGNTIVVSATGEASNATTVDGNQADNSSANAGAVYVFTRSGTAWSQQSYLKASNNRAVPSLHGGMTFGDSVAISGNTIVVGAPGDASNASGVNGNPNDSSIGNAGAAYVFVRSGTLWSQQAYLKASNNHLALGGFGMGMRFGDSVGISGNTIVVGAPQDESGATGVNGNQLDQSASRSGAGYVFVRSGSTWSQQSYLKASNTSMDDMFGAVVAVAGDTIVVGASGEDSGAAGVNGNQSDNGASGAGAGYVFVRRGTTWSQQAYLKASNTGAGDSFGEVGVLGLLALPNGDGVAVAATTVLIGAAGESSNATGVDGQGNNDAKPLSGAAYVFTLHDECTDPAPLSIGVHAGLSTVGATTSSPPMSCGNGGSDVWYSFTAACTGVHTFDTCGPGTNFNTVLELYSGTCGALTSIACNDDACGTSSSIVALLTQGVTYLLRLGGVNGASGTADLRVLPSSSDPIAVQQAYVKASNTGVGDNFGYAVAVSGDTMVVGAWEEASNAIGINGNQLDNSALNAGAAYVFVRTGTTWSQQAYLKASNTDPGDAFGRAVAISGDTIVVGAHGESSVATGVNGPQFDNSAAFAGAAYVFVRTGTTWSQQAYLKASNTGVGDTFGEVVAIAGDTIVVGAPGEDSNATGVNGNQADNSTAFAGAAYVFVRNGTTWSQQAYLKASNTANDVFGSAVAVFGQTIAVGAPGEDSNATGVNGNQLDNSAPSAGAVYVFTRSGTTWSQQAYLKASNTDAGDGFGSAVAVAANSIVVGAPHEDSNATGVNGNQTDNSATWAGAAYAFRGGGSFWFQNAYIKASNTGADDQFGTVVAISPEDARIVVGTQFEDSNATGINCDQLDNSAASAGAAYVFVRLGPNVFQEAYVKASNTGHHDSFGCSVAVSGNTVVVGAFGEESTATGIDGNQWNNQGGQAGAAYALLFYPNDECGGATPLALGVNPGNNTIGATLSAPLMTCTSSTSRDLWYTYTAAVTGPHSFDTCGIGTNFDTALELYSGSCGALTSMGCNDDACGQASRVTAPLIQGTTYFLRLAGSNGQLGLADIRVSTGTGTGTIAPSTTVSLCPSTATFGVTGNPNIGNSVVLNLSGASGLPFVGYGFPALIPLPVPCGCDLISDGGGGIGFFDFTSSRSLALPLDPFFIGVSFFGQGLDVFAATGGCSLGLTFGLTDIWTITIG